MFGQLLFVRLRAAEKALAEGRLEEAHRLATQPDIREHKRGKATLGSLSEKLVARAREHYRADRFNEALMDLDRAEAGGTMEKEIQELRGYIRTVAAEHARKQESQFGRVHEARQRIERGSLAAGRNLLEQADEGHAAAEALKRKVEARADDVKSMLQQVRNLMKSSQWASAAERLRRAKALDGHAPELAELESELCSKVLDRAQAALIDGRLGRVNDELAPLHDLGRALPARQEIAEALRISGEAAQCIKAHDYAGARRHTLTLSRLLPDAKWVSAVVDELRQMNELHTSLSAGPLGDRLSPSNPPFARDGDRAGVVRIRARDPLEDTIGLPTHVEVPGGWPGRLLLLVDGGGSYLLLRGAQAAVGRAASEIPADIPIFSDISERHANINRVDDDYFLLCGKDAEIAGKRVQHALLRDGDKVMFGKKAKFTFRLPSRKSSSALLELSDTTKMPNDVRKVILFNQLAMIGQSNNVHVYCRHAGPTLLLFERAGSLWLRAQSDGFVDTQAIPLRLGESVELAGVSMVLQTWKTPGQASV